MRYWLAVILGCVLALPAVAAVEIVDLPSTPDESYDLTWTVVVQSVPKGPLCLGVEQDASGRGYVLTLDKGSATWQQVGIKSPLPPVAAPLPLETGKRYLLSLKRRQDTIALLRDHRLVLTAPAPSTGTGTSDFRTVPAGLAVGEARYRVVGRPFFGDDFMRPESRLKVATGKPGWIDDDTWKVAFFRKDHPSDIHPTNPMTGLELSNPWSLSLFNNYLKTVTNGFWWWYIGAGPSWVVANPTMVYPTWDRYYVEAATRPDNDSEVGIIAAYQDNKNYLLFRWKQREYLLTGAARAQLVAVIDGQQKVLATSLRGFEPGQWYTLRINLGWRRVQALVDRQVLMEADNPGSVEGRVGMYAYGSPAPRRPKVDAVTASMFATTDEATGMTLNDAADALRTDSCIYFDDFRVGSWQALEDMTTSSYPVDRTGRWKINDRTYEAWDAGRLVTGFHGGSRYVFSTRVRIKSTGSAGVLFHLDNKRAGYAWVLTASGQRVQPVNGDTWLPPVDRSDVRLPAGEWADARVEADGPYVALYLNNRRVMEVYNPARTGGRCGLLALAAGAQFREVSVAPMEKHFEKVLFNQTFTTDKWLTTWSSPEADWYPTFTPRAYITPMGLPHVTIGASAPLPTDQAGLYWHKGGHYHDLRVTFPVTATSLTGQTLHLSANYVPDAGYRIVLAADKGNGVATLMRAAKEVGRYPIPIGKSTQLVFERRGNFLVLRAQELDTDTVGDPDILSDVPVFIYHDPQPLKAEKIGFTVTTPDLPAAKVTVVSDRIQETFEKAPSRWVTESGVWAVMARYSCQPQWNYFGGFGATTPTVWSKYRLDGDQTVEGYLGIKMQYDNAPEEYARRYRDVNMTICSDGSYLNSGYSVIRAGRAKGAPVTMLLRKGVVVARSTEPAHLLPPQGTGHRQWFTIRMEKRGAEIKVYLDNRLWTSYTDPDPIPGGYAGFWTLNNGIMLGRANLSAERMTIGSPRAAAPLAVQEKLDPQPLPQVTVNGTAPAISTFEAGAGDWKERPGLSGRIVQERTTDANGRANTVLKVVNMYPAGDFSVSCPMANGNLAAAPMLDFDYCFDSGVKVNLYLRRGTNWYEFLLTAPEAQEANVFTVGRLPATADGQWHHLRANLARLLEDAITKQNGQKPADLVVQELVLADWSEPAEERQYGFGSNRGGMAIRVDNVAFTPVLSSPTALAWSGQGITRWRTALDNQPMGVPTAETTATTLSVTPQSGAQFMHLQGGSADGKWGPVIHVPLTFAP